MNLSDLRINGERLWDSLMRMAEIGATPAGGCNRQALSDDDKRGRDLFCRWCEEARCDVRVDAMGNIFARRRAQRDAGPAVLVGSHLDTQPTGGKFDGVYGVLAGLELVRTLNDVAYIGQYPLDVVVWTNEEGSRFSPAMNGSGVWAGELDLDTTYAQQSVDGRKFADELRRIGYLGPEPATHFPIRAAFELHIEQGPVLELENKSIGAVTGAQAIRWYDLEILGTPSHAGTTPMPMRHDPVVTASAVIGDFTAELGRFGDEARATFGVMRSTPNSRNTVAACTSMSLDLRHPEPQQLDAMETALNAQLERYANANGTTPSLNRIWDCPPTRFDPTCVAAVRAAAERLDYSYRDIVSGAGHDAVYVQKVAPTAMIFVPCAGGLSHNEAESASPDDLEAGCNVLLHAVLSRDNA